MRCLPGGRPQHSVRAELELGVRNPLIDLVTVRGSVRMAARDVIPPGTFITYLDPQDAQELSVTQSSVLRVIGIPSATSPECFWESVSTSALTLRDRLGFARYVSCDTSDEDVNVSWVCESNVVIDVVDSHDRLSFSAPYWWLRAVKRISPGQFLTCSHFTIAQSATTTVQELPVATDSTPGSKRKRSPVQQSTPNQARGSQLVVLDDDHSDEGDASEIDDVKGDSRTKGSNRRNDCASARRWVELDKSVVWWRWPSFPLKTRHIMNRKGGISEPMQRSYALQFGSRFRLSPDTTADDLRNSIRSLNHPARHFHLNSATAGKLGLPVQNPQTGSAWRRAIVNSQRSTVLSEGICAEQLSRLLPDESTDWAQLFEENTVSFLSFKESCVSTHDRTSSRYIIVLLTGSAVAIWTTKRLYDVALKAKAYRYAKHRFCKQCFYLTNLFAGIRRCGHQSVSTNVSFCSSSGRCLGWCCTSERTRCLSSWSPQIPLFSC